MMVYVTIERTYWEDEGTFDIDIVPHRTKKAAERRKKTASYSGPGGWTDVSIRKLTVGGNEIRM